jgi:hypothetical protein
MQFVSRSLFDPSFIFFFRDEELGWMDGWMKRTTGQTDS